ncbi:MAG: ABC transporter permease [Lachnospiraceae bacterium]|nr:ABC transporter permease [Lachnospiraceae bacterium]
MENAIVYFQNNGREYFGLLMGHIGISFVSVLAAMVVAVPLGIVCAGRPRLKSIAEAGFGLLRIVPSLAILILLIPIIGTGVKPAVIALVLLAVPPILINTVQAFLTLPPEMLEASLAMGMNPREQFFKVKLPLAFPLMFAGIRTATVEVIASTTIASYIGAGGLGDIIFTGLALLRTDLLFIGGGSVAVLSLLTGYLMDRYYRYITRWQP